MFSSNVEKEDKANRGMAPLLLRIPMVQKFRVCPTLWIGGHSADKFSRLLTVSEGLLYGHAMKVLRLEIL